MPRHSTLRALLVPVAASLVLAACSPDVNDAVAAAKKRIVQGDSAGAEVALKAVTQKFPKSAEARFLLGQHLLRKGDTPAALVELERALGLNFDTNLVTPLRARAMVLSGKVRQVVEQFSEVTLTDRTAQAELAAVVAIALARQGNQDKAKALIDRTVTEHPDAASPQLAKAQLVAARGDRSQAIGLVDAVLDKHPASEDGWAIKGDLLLSQADGQKPAQEAYRKALGVNPNHLHARVALITMLIGAKDLAAATTELAVLRKAVPNHFASGFLDAQLAMAKNEPLRARAVFQALLKQAPDHPLVLQGAAANELRLNGLEQAETLASKALTLAPGSNFARRVLAQTYLNKGMPDRTIKVMAPLVDKADAAPGDLALAGQAQLTDGNTRAADALFQRLAKSKPSDPRLRTLVVAAGTNQGGADAAIEQLQAISGEDSDITADLILINTHLQAGKLDAALQVVTGIQAKQPKRPLPDMLRARILDRKGDQAGSRLALEAALAKDPKYIPAVNGLVAFDLAEKRLDAAKQRYQALLKLQPNNAIALLAMAQLSRRSDASEATVRGFLDKAILADPESLAVRQAVIEQYMATGDQRSALNTANAAATAMPASVTVLERLAQVQVRAGELDLALSSYGKIAQLQPNAPVGPLGMGRVHLARGDLVQAQREAQRVLGQEPHHREGTALLVNTLLQLKQYAAAQKVARGFKGTLPDQALGYQLEADVEMAQGHWDAAAALLKPALDKAAAGGTQLKLHQVLVKAGKSAEAEAFGKQWVTSHPADTTFQFYLGERAQAAGRVAVAEQHYRELLATEPGHAYALNNLAMLLVQQKRPGAQELIDKALVARPDEPALLDTQAELHAAGRQWSKAIETQARAVARAPKAVELRLRLARYQAEGGKKREAIAELGRLANSSLPMTEAQKSSIRQAQVDLRR